MHHKEDGYEDKVDSVKDIVLHGKHLVPCKHCGSVFHYSKHCPHHHHK